MTADTIRSYVRTNLFTDDELQLDEASYSNNTAIYRSDQFAFALQQLEEDKLHNMDEKEHMIMRDGELATMIQQQEEEEAHKLIQKEQRAMT